MKHESLLWVVLLGLLVSGVQARTVEGVTLPESAAVAGQTLVLNGAGVREKFFFDIYVAALYLPQRQSDAQAILDSGASWRMVMHFLYSKVGRSKIAKGWEEGFADNQSREQLAVLRQRLEQFKALFPDLHRGDEVILDHAAGGGVTVTLDGQRLGTVPGEDFARALLAVWLGPRPVTASLKKALLQGR